MYKRKSDVLHELLVPSQERTFIKMWRQARQEMNLEVDERAPLCTAAIAAAWRNARPSEKSDWSFVLSSDLGDQGGKRI